jgi:endoglucanase
MAGTRLFVDPNSEAMNAYRGLYASNPARAALVAEIAFEPQGVWLLDDGATVVASAVAQARAVGQIPLLVAYNMNNVGPDGYAMWIEGVATEIGSATVYIVLEPDALPTRGSAIAPVLAAAVTTLKANPNAAVLIDAGHSAWLSPGQAVSLLRDAGIAKADGFSLNVSNFRAMDELTAYGDGIAAELQKFFVIDTSRNGDGPYGTDWCNPPGRALGLRPAIDPDRAHHPWLNAYLWVKRPGESDGDAGNCYGGPAAGVWWEDYAVALVTNAGGATLAAGTLPAPLVG